MGLADTTDLTPVFQSILSQPRLNSEFRLGLADYGSHYPDSWQSNYSNAKRLGRAAFIII
jgi:hypothetical protein